MSAGVFGLLAGVSLAALAAGTAVAMGDRPMAASSLAPAWLLFVAGLGFATAGLLVLIVGRALLRRKPRGRTAALALVAPSLLLVPFGTALAVYSVWTLLNDDARREYAAR